MGSSDAPAVGLVLVARVDQPVLSEARSPWPGAYYGLPLLTLVLGGVLVAAWALHLVVRRPRQGEDQVVDDALRRRAARAIVAAVGLLVAVPAAGVTLVASITLAGSSCPTGWDVPVALLLGLSAPALLVLAVGTVARAYRELEQAGLVSTRRGGGTRVRADLARRDPAARVHDLDLGAEALVRTARLLGAGADEVRAAVDRALNTGSEAR